MQQMDWREALDDAHSLEDLDNLGLQVKLAMRDELLKCERFLDQLHDYLQAAQQVRALMFIERFERDVQARLDQMDTTERGQ